MNRLDESKWSDIEYWTIIEAIKFFVSTDIWKKLNRFIDIEVILILSKRRSKKRRKKKDLRVRRSEEKKLKYL